MPILHSLPRKEHPENRLLALYHEGLRRHWGRGNIALATALGLVGLGTGWSRAERRFLSDEIRASGMSMADRRGVHRLINPAGYPLAGNVLRNKRLFADHVRAHGLASPDTFNPSAGALADWLQGQQEIVAKRGYSSKGKGVVAFDQADGWRIRQIEDVLAKHGVVQERLKPHAALEGLSPGALPTLRVVTCLDEGGAPEAAAVVLRLGGGGPRPVDNFNAGGLAVRVDADGRCAIAYRASGSSTEELRVHPANGETIVAREVPDFAEAIGLARRAHATLPRGYTVVGWDIGLSDRGPLLIEGNWNHGTDIVQLVGGKGLDRMRLGELYRFHLRRLPPEAWRSARPVEW